MNMITTVDVARDHGFETTHEGTRQALVVIVCEVAETVEQLEAVCDFFALPVAVVPERTDLMPLLREHRPMAVISDIDGQHQDGFHAMKTVASFDRDLPILLLTGGDPILMGAADAVQEQWSLTMVSRSTSSPLAAQLAEFLFTAGRRAGCMRLVPV